jgi:uncharacterized membrane protein
MALTRCKECAAAVSTKATARPRCGAKQGASTSGCLITIFILVFIFFVVIVLSGGRKSSASQSASIQSENTQHQNINWGAPENSTIAYKLLCLDTGERGISDSDYRIARYQEAIDTIRTRFKISESVIGDQTWTAVDTLRKMSRQTSAIEMMDGVAGIKGAEDLGISYTEILANVMTIMQSKSKN